MKFDNIKRALTLNAIGLCLTLAMQIASATQVTYNYAGKSFANNYGGTYAATDKIVGSISFDPTVLDPNGNGVINVTSPADIPSLTWGFTDGHISYDNNNTTSNYRMRFNFSNGTIFNWEIDATFGATNPYLWSIGSLNNVHEEGRDTLGYGYADASGNGIGLGYWSGPQTQQVPEPASLALLGLAGAAMAWSQRRRRDVTANR